ncbi:MAG: DUF1858 domain-containing protein [Bacteroidales bacterium]
MIPITPQTRVGELLEAYPYLEDTLLKLSPKFGHLKNPVLRRTVARIATLQQAAQMAGISVELLVNTLRKEAGLDEIIAVAQHEEQLNVPSWFDTANIHAQLDITPLIESGQHPLGQVLETLKQLPMGKILLIIAPFYPAPLADMAREKGFEVFSRSTANSKVYTYFYKP